MLAEKIRRIAKSNHNVLILLIPLSLLIPLYIILYKIYMPRVNAFGCFDDCNNFMGGYFLLAGKVIFTDFYFNHQPFTAFISYFVQAIATPQNIFELILRHRQFLMIFSLIFNALLIVRFRLPAFLFVVLYEPAKFYLFGDRFLAEGMIVYPLVYMAGLALLKLSNDTRKANSDKLLKIDYFLLPAFAWFVIFMREPYVPLAVLLFILILYQRINTLIQARIALVSIGIFISLCVVTLMSFNIPEYFFNVVTVNYTALLPSDIKTEMFGNRLTQAFFYPVYIFFYGESNILRNLLILINIVFLANLFILIRNKKYLLAIGILAILAFANIRVIEPGTMFYEAFHMLVWFALFIFITTMLVFSNFVRKKLFYASIFILLIGLLTFVGSKSYFAKEPFDQHEALLTHYGETMQIGEVVRALSNKDDTLFLDASDDLIYWQAKLPTPYKYTHYTGAMPHFKKYTDARLEMFRENPPNFYKEFGSCPKENDIGESYRLPDFAVNDYIRLYKESMPSCLFVHKNKIPEITGEQWKKAAEWLYAKN